MARRAPRTLNFTKAAIDQLPTPPSGRRDYHYDQKTPGLAICVTPTGSKTFYLVRRIDDIVDRNRLGSWPEMTVERARKAADKNNGKIAEGHNPAAERRQKRHEATLKGAFDHWLETHAKTHKKTWQDDERQFNKYLATLHNRKLSAITKADVVAIHGTIGKDNGPIQANRTLALLRAVFNKADELGFNGLNPAAKVKKFREQSRDRFLQPAELPKFFTALNAEPNETLRDFFLLAIFTGARRSNVQAMRWADVDLDQATWRIPETKAGRVQHVPLAAPAVAVLRRRSEAATGSEYVLASRAKCGHVVEVKSAWKRILTASGLEDLRPHDLRRTLASYMAIQGASLNIIGATLGHSQAQTTQVYARLTNTAVADGVTKAVAFIDEAGKPPEKEKPKRARKAKAGASNG